MNKITKLLNNYMTTHPFDSGDSDCETVLDQLYQAYAEAHETDSAESSNGFKELEELLYTRPLEVTTLSLTSVVGSVAPMNTKPSLTVSNMDRT